MHASVFDDYREDAMNKCILVGLLILDILLITGCGSGDQQGKTKIAANLPGANATMIPRTLEQKLKSCNVCHGDKKTAMSPSYPYLDGQYKAYLVKQLSDFMSGKRQEHVMVAMTDDLTVDEVDKLTTHFAEKKRRSVTPSADRAAIALGKQVYAKRYVKGDIKSSCVGCHGAKGEGDSVSNVPALTGQKASYLIMSLYHFKYLLRTNDPDSVMRNMAANMNDTDILAVSDYITTLK